ncbi:hypothetical protein NDU88_007072 [Pleurodeles waltl]|uniref:Uncharacterized protein n=1 Tax=Pleurodeles waltl TaxID=8319 RepID=A0AAV7N5C9_PLEWA|nr:hypothetical protein NDU88_007072 [Pleurodeles waltl]
MGAGHAPLPPHYRVPSAHGRFIQCTAACSLLSRDESALQCAPLASARAAGETASLRESPVSARAASLAAPVPAGAPTLWDQTPPHPSGPMAPPGTDSTSRWSPRLGYFQGLIVGPSGATFSSVGRLGCLVTPLQKKSALSTEIASENIPPEWSCISLYFNIQHVCA